MLHLHLHLHALWRAVHETMGIDAYDRPASLEYKLVYCEHGRFRQTLGMNDQQNVDVIYVVRVRGDRFDFILFAQLVDKGPRRSGLLALSHHHLGHIPGDVITHHRQ